MHVSEGKVEELNGMDDTQLLAQKISNLGAIHALKHLLEGEFTKDEAQGMIDSLEGVVVIIDRKSNQKKKLH